MATEQSSDDRRSQAQETLGEELGGVFSYLKDGLIVLRYEWRIFSEWFRAYQERVELLNKVSGSTSLILQNALRERTIIKICRLTDPAKQGRNRNASLPALLEYDLTNGDTHLMGLIGEATVASASIRALRSKRLVHADKDNALFDTGLSGVSYIEIDKAIAAISEAIKYFAVKYQNTTLLLNVTSSFSSDEVAFLEILQLGLEAKSKRDEEFKNLLKAGKYDEAEKQRERAEWILKRKYDVFE